jgi:alternate signal-mediated exported protein
VHGIYKVAAYLGAAALLILGGESSMALWTRTFTPEQGPSALTTGALTASNPACDGWTYSNTVPAGTPGANGTAVTVVIPGDTITNTCHLYLTVQGDHLSVGTSVTNPTWKSAYWLAGTATNVSAPTTSWVMTMQGPGTLDSTQKPPVFTADEGAASLTPIGSTKVSTTAGTTAATITTAGTTATSTPALSGSTATVPGGTYLVSVVLTSTFPYSGGVSAPLAASGANNRTQSATDGSVLTQASLNTFSIAFTQLPTTANPN